MEKEAMQEIRTVIRTKRLEKGLTFAQLAQLVGKNPTFLAAALQGNHRLSDHDAQKIGQALGLDQQSTRALTQFPVRTDFPNTTDPFKYRLLEIIGVYGDALREMANEMFGDGIMSDIDFTIEMQRVTGSEGEARCQITLNGKWLEYKTF